jgi:hypothetical protein
VSTWRPTGTWRPLGVIPALVVYLAFTWRPRSNESLASVDARFIEEAFFTYTHLLASYINTPVKAEGGIDTPLVVCVSVCVCECVSGSV